MKTRVKKVLDTYGVYYLMPVQFGIGATGVDFHCAVEWNGLSIAFFIETKAPNKPLTARQEKFLEDRNKKQKSQVFVIDGDWGIRLLIAWLEKLKNEQRRNTE